jgi:pimeloyl-ACP methyl ester carboxylesterase
VTVRFLTPMASRPPRSRSARAGLAAAALTAGVAGVTVLERRHLRRIAADPTFRELSTPLPGRPLAPIVSADGTRLRAERYGAEPAPGRPAPATLVLAHGWTEQRSWWRPVIRRLASPQLSIVAYDLRGHGDSEPAASGDYALERFGEDVEAVLAAAGAPAARTALAGHSLGAMSIAAWAAGFDVGERIAAAALVNTGLSDLIGGGLIFGELGARLAPQWLGRALLGSRRPVLPVSTPLSQATARHIAFGRDAPAGAVAFYERMLMGTDPGARAAVGIALSTLDLSAAVARIAVPTLVVAGADDRLTPPAHAQRIHAALPRPAELVVFPRTGHMSALERPEELTAALRSLLAATGVLDPDGPAEPAPAAGAEMPR